MRQSQSWKNLERKTAKLSGGKRNKRGRDFSESMPDVEHPIFVFECKYRKKFPKFLVEGLKQAERYDQSKVPVLILKQKNMKGELAVFWFNDIITITK